MQTLVPHLQELTGFSLDSPMIECEFHTFTVTLKRGGRMQEENMFGLEKFVDMNKLLK